ncbi:hypothetical protein [Pseudonocardia adelaidensis]|uniref:Uncharacterized protein n=1 Tax=Pseudonocardia adelaidensis TaxID=648754 RepID=A0ABP9P5K6_9PSEU
MNVTTSLDPASSSAVTGAAAATHTLRVRNGGDTVEECQLSVVGPLARWAVLAPDRLRRYPGDEGTARFPFSVTMTPADPDTAAGAQPVQLRGTYVRLALIPTCLLLALTALLLAAAVAAGLLYLPFTNLQRFVFPQPPPVVVAAPNVQLPQQVQPPAPQPARQAPQQVQPPPPPEQNQGGQNQRLTVTIAHGDLALTAVDSPRRDGSPAPVVGPRNAGGEAGRIWTLVRLRDAASPSSTVARRTA